MDIKDIDYSEEVKIEKFLIPYDPQIYLTNEAKNYRYYLDYEYALGEKDEIVDDILKSPLRSYMYRLLNRICSKKDRLFVDQFRCILLSIGEDYNDTMVHETYIDKNRFQNDLNDYFYSIMYRNNLTEIDKYLKLLLTYDKYNKLNILNNNSKLPKDVVFKLIIEYL